MLQDLELGDEPEQLEEKICFKCIECGIITHPDDLQFQNHEKHTLELMQVPHQLQTQNLNPVEASDKDLIKAIAIMYKYLI